jgi:hypothetical protein
MPQVVFKNSLLAAENEIWSHGLPRYVRESHIYAFLLELARWPSQMRGQHEIFCKSIICATGSVENYTLFNLWENILLP